VIWLLGRRGMLGRVLEQELSAAQMPYHSSGRECDVTSEESISANAPNPAPRWVINCTGYTAVDKAESEVNAAWAVNQRAAAHLAQYCAAHSSRLLHLSTDYVFDGSEPKGYTEAAPTAPQNVYGASKAAGEQAVRSALAQHVIIRTAWLHAEHGRNFVLTVLRLLRERGELTIVDDQHGSPTYARDLARAIVAIAGSAQPAYGTFHYTNSGETSWHDFACQIQDYALELGLSSRRRTIRAISSAQFPTAAVRPTYSLLLCEHIAQTYGVELRPWHQGLRECMERVAARVTQ